MYILLLIKERYMSFEEIKYKKNFLDTVIFRMDFSDILLLKDSIEASFQEGVKSIFPKLTTNFCSAYTGMFSPTVVNVGHENIKLYEFSNSSMGLSLKISYNSLVLETKKYIDFEKFTDVLQKILSEFNKFYTGYEINRIGLRFINLIRITSKSPLEWSDYIDSKLLESINFAKNLTGDNCYLNRCMNQLSFRFKNDNSLTFNYGIYNSEWPAQITQNEFILDFDAYTTCLDISEDIQSKYLIPFHDIIQESFEKGITKKLRKVMNDEK